MSWEGIHELIVRAKAGDNDAWQSLHEMVRPYLMNRAQHLLGPGWAHKSVSDLMQDTWQRVCTRIATFHGGADDAQTAPLFRAWVRVTMKNVHANWQRDQSAQRRQVPGRMLSLSVLRPGDSTDGPPALDPIADESSVSAGLRGDEQRALIEQILDDLDDPEDRRLIQAHFFEGCSLRKIAEEQGVSDGTIRHRLQRVLDRLGRGLKDLQ
jgi:RNA polymerase sigma factor (sigma-70 family)